MVLAEGDICLVTGASSGFGEAIALALGGAKCKVAIFARRADRLEAVAEKIRTHGGEALVVVGDVAKKEDVSRCVQEVVAKWGTIHHLINNAGIMLLAYFKNADLGDLDAMIDVNIKGPIYCTHAVLPHMRQANKTCNIISISSDADRKVFPGSATYSATKAALSLFSEGVRFECANDKVPVRFTSISAGAGATELFSHVPDQEIKTLFGSFPPMHMLNGPDIASVVMNVLQSADHMDYNNILVRPTEQAS